MIILPSKKCVTNEYTFLIKDDKLVYCLQNILHFGNPKAVPMMKYNVICQLVKTNQAFANSSKRLECTIKGLPNLFVNDSWSKAEEKNITKVKLWGVFGAKFLSDLKGKREEGKRTIIRFKKLALTQYLNESPHLTSIDGKTSGKPTSWKIYMM
jgi:hypothetical protein